jgi:hypothetical protein
MVIGFILIRRADLVVLKERDVVSVGRCFTAICLIVTGEESS